MSVKKIFIILITVVACVMIGAFVLNILMPNVMVTVVNAVENMITRATGMAIDLNGDGSGQNTKKAKAQAGTKEGAAGASVQGYQNGMQ